MCFDEMEPPPPPPKKKKTNKKKTFFYHNRYPHPDNRNSDLQHVYTEVHYNARYQSAVG